MKKLLIVAALAIPLAACGGTDTAEEAHVERAEELEEAADASIPAGAEQLENLAEQHERKAELLDEIPGERQPEIDPMAPIPDNVSVGEEGG